MKTIDGHVHIFPPDTIRKRDAVAAADKNFSVLYGNERAAMADFEKLQKYLDDENISACFVCGFSFVDTGLLRASNDYILESSKKDSRIIPFIAAGNDKKTIQKEIERCTHLGARGIGEISFYSSAFRGQERRLLEILAEHADIHGLPIIVHVNEQVGHYYAGKYHIDLQEIVDFVGAHSALKIILAHLGGGLCFAEFMPEIKKSFKNVSYDVAAAPFLYNEEICKYVEMFLPDKVLFATDFPLLTLGKYTKFFRGMGNSAREKVFYKNAEKIFR